jgi:hypothetical protein
VYSVLAYLFFGDPLTTYSTASAFSGDRPSSLAFSSSSPSRLLTSHLISLSSHLSPPSTSLITQKMSYRYSESPLSALLSTAYPSPLARGALTSGSLVTQQLRSLPAEEAETNGALELAVERAALQEDTVQVEEATVQVEVATVQEREERSTKVSSLARAERRDAAEEEGLTRCDCQAILVVLDTKARTLALVEEVSLSLLRGWRDSSEGARGVDCFYGVSRGV